MQAVPDSERFLGSGAGQRLRERRQSRRNIIVLKDTDIGEEQASSGHGIRSIRVTNKRESTPGQEGVMSLAESSRKQATSTLFKK